MTEAALLTAVLQRTDLRVVAPLAGDSCECVYVATWPGEPVTITAPTRELAALLAAAAADVDDLWPGRDRSDGAMSLVAIGLQSLLDARRAPARSALLSGLRWVLDPAESRSTTDQPGGDGFEWRAAGT